MGLRVAAEQVCHAAHHESDYHHEEASIHCQYTEHAGVQAPQLCDDCVDICGH